MSWRYLWQVVMVLEDVSVTDTTTMVSLVLASRSKDIKSQFVNGLDDPTPVPCVWGATNLQLGSKQLGNTRQGRLVWWRIRPKMD